MPGRQDGSLIRTALTSAIARELKSVSRSRKCCTTLATRHASLIVNKSINGFMFLSLYSGSITLWHRSGEQGTGTSAQNKMKYAKFTGPDMHPRVTARQPRPCYDDVMGWHWGNNDADYNRAGVAKAVTGSCKTT